MTRIKIKNFFFLLFAWAISIVTIIVYYSYYKVDINKYIYAIVYAFFSSCTMIYVFGCFDNNDTDRISLAPVLLLITTLYNQNALTKFSVDKLFIGFVSNQMIRLFGSIVFDLLIMFVAFRYKRKNKDTNDTSATFEELFRYKKPSIIFIYIMIILYAIIKFQELSTKIEFSRTQSTFINAITYAVYFLISLNAFLYRKNVVFAYTPLLIVTSLQFVASVKSGRKAEIIVFMFIIMMELVYLGCIKIEVLKMAFCISPAILQIITVLTEAISGRMRFFSKGFVMEYHAFRYDLSDFAISIAMNYKPSKLVIQLISESFIYAIPGFSIDVKKNILENGAYRMLLENMGFPRYDIYGSMSDFNDTFFSVGAQIGGFIGIPLFFIIIVAFFDWLSRVLCRNRYGKVLVMILIGPCALVECDLKMLIFRIRDLVIIIVVAYMIIKLLCKDG